MYIHLFIWFKWSIIDCKCLFFANSISLKSFNIIFTYVAQFNKKTLLKYLIYFIILKLTPIIQFSFKFPLLISLYTWNHLPFRIKFNPCFDYIFSPLRLNNLSNIYQCICILLFYTTSRKARNNSNIWIKQHKILIISE